MPSLKGRVPARHPSIPTEPGTIHVALPDPWPACSGTSSGGIPVPLDLIRLADSLTISDKLKGAWEMTRPIPIGSSRS